MAIGIAKDRPTRRVLLVAPMPPPYGGMAIQARLLAKLLHEDGIAVRVFASNFALPTPFRPCDRVPFVRTLVRAIAIWFKLLKRAWYADVIHIFGASWLYFFLVVAPAVLIGKLLRKRVVLNYRGGHAAHFFRYWGWAAAPVLWLADAITAPSAFLAHVIRDRFRLPVTIVRNVLDESLFAYRQRATIQPKFVVARHLEAMYGVEAVLRAFGTIQQWYPEASLSVIGTGSQERRLRALARESNLHNVDFLGHLAHEEMQGFYDRCDIFLNGSTVDNFPGSLLEASAAGLVVVSTGVGGIPFMYQNGKDALLVPPGDWQALASATKQLLESPALARQLIAGGAALVRCCCWESVRASVYDVYGFSQETIMQPQSAPAAH